MSGARETAPFGVVLPVKRAALAKTRLAPLGEEVRRELVVAFALDTASAAAGCEAVDRVLVVTDEVALAAALADLDIDAIPDGESDRLNASLRLGAAELLRRRPRLRPVALCADLPALRPEELAAVLAEVPAEGAAFVADAAGTGTTLYTAARLEIFSPRFGDDSRRAHASSGAVDLTSVAAPSVRRDVDTPDDLEAARDLGVGPRTALVLTRFGLMRRTSAEG